ncbi:MAG TPA: hypothetical protein VHE61_21850 [Opitutaceae bacterium]|nr:hypothetical protein [Opitutaceae bacterium]
MITYEIDGTARLVTCSVNAHLRVLDIAEVIGHLFADRSFDPEYNTLVIVADETVIPDVVARNALAELLQAWRKLHVPAKWALILPTNGWLRAANQVIEQYELGSQNVRCFPDCTMALAWFYECTLPIVRAR